MTDTSRPFPSPAPRRPGPVLPVAHRQPARRHGPHRPVQLGLRPPHRRHLRVPHRGHRLGARHARSPTSDLLEALRWLGLDWDEGPEVGGPHEPYRQSRAAGPLRRRRRAGWSTPVYAYESLLHAGRGRGAPQGRRPGPEARLRQLRPRPLRRAEGRVPRRGPPARAARPDARRGLSRWDDLVRGEITFKAEHVPDYVIVRANGEPLYTLVNPVDDALMGITHVLRGEDLLSSTPRQLALYDALAQIGVGDGYDAALRPPAVRHGRGQQEALQARPAVQPAQPLPRARASSPRACSTTSRCSAGRPATTASSSRRRRWSSSSTSPTCSPTRPASTPRSAWPSTATGSGTSAPTTSPTGWCPTCRPCGALAGDADAEQQAVIDAAVPLVQERMETLRGGRGACCGFLLVDEADFAVDRRGPASACSPTTRGPRCRRRTTRSRRSSRSTTRPSRRRCARRWSRGSGSSRKLAFGPVRVAVTGRRISPPLFESIELLGRERTLGRLAGALAAESSRRALRRRPQGASVWASARRRAIIHVVDDPRGSLALGYGVIGSPTDSGSVSLGSSPGTPADRDDRPMRGTDPRWICRSPRARVASRSAGTAPARGRRSTHGPVV